MNFRIGFGYDVHRLAAGEKLILGGIEIPYKKGTIAHSDGDLLIHAICDALLGAANLHDLGYHFPDSSDKFKGISSLIILQKVINLLKKEQYRIVNLDTTICMQQPKIKDYAEKIAENLAPILETGSGNISIKATTTEKMGFIGKEKGVAAYAVVLIYKDDSFTT